MERTEKEAVALLLSTVEHFKTHPRSIHMSSGRCLYRKSPGIGCAVGIRMLPRNPVFRSQRKNAMGVNGIEETIGLDNVLQPEYRGYPLELWKNLQSLHDYGNNWEEDSPNATKRELSKTGQKAVSHIKLMIRKLRLPKKRKTK